MVVTKTDEKALNNFSGEGIISLYTLLGGLSFLERLA